MRTLSRPRVERRKRLDRTTGLLDAFSAVAIFSFPVFCEFGGDGGIEVESEAAGAVEDADEDVGEFFFEVGFVVAAEPFESFGGFRVDERDHGGDLVGFAPIVRRADGPAVGAVDVVDLAAEVGEEGWHEVFRKGSGGEGNPAIDRRTDFEARQLSGGWRRTAP
jgi:hypothetical protein